MEYRSRSVVVWSSTVLFLAIAFQQSICDARKARPEGPSRCFGCGSFVEERRSSGEARRAEPTSPFLVASDKKRQILSP